VGERSLARPRRDGRRRPRDRRPEDVDPRRAPVAVVDAVVDRRGTRAVAEAYLRFLYSPGGQALAAKHHYRPRDPDAAAKAGRTFPSVATFTVDGLFGGWRAAQKKHFDDGGVFDSLFATR
jgi:sulfate/thiosulfate transport system substrate-binding protein